MPHLAAGQRKEPFMSSHRLWLAFIAVLAAATTACAPIAREWPMPAVTRTPRPVLPPHPRAEPVPSLRDLQGGAFTAEYFSQVAPVSTRARIRYAKPPYRADGTVAAFAGDTVMLKTGRSTPQRAVPIASVSALDVSVPDPLKGALNGGMVGYAIGCAAAGLYGAASWPEDRFMAAGYWCIFLGPLGIIPGAAIGALTSAGRRWRAVPPLREHGPT
jgi:hypothetical protein